MADAVGIDFGTSTSKVVSYVDGEFQHARISHVDGMLMPSVVRFEPETGSVVVGMMAKARAFSMADHVYPCAFRPRHGPIKTNLTASEDEFEVFRPSDGGRFPKPEYAAVDMAEELFAYMLESTNLAEAVVSVPAYFSSEEVGLIREAAQNAGVFVASTIAEPAAAALSYAWLNSLEGNVVVYDFGGGTFDTTVMAVTGSTYEVFAKLGNPRLGGYLLDTVIYDTFLRPRAEGVTGFQLDLDGQGVHPKGYDGANRYILFEMAENAKKTLSSTPLYTETATLWEERGRETEVEFAISRSELEDAVRHLITGTMETVVEVVDRAGMDMEDIDHFLAVGGVTRMPIIREQIRSLAGADKLRVPNDPDIAVAEGAALVASREPGLDMVVHDVLARALRMRVPKSSRTEVIIPSGTPTGSAENTLTFNWPRSGAEEANIHLCEGSEDEFHENDPVGVLVISPQQSLSKNTRVQVTFRFDPESSSFVASARTEDAQTAIDVSIQKDTHERATGASMDVIEQFRADIVFCIDISGSARNGQLAEVCEQCLRLEEGLQLDGVDARFGVVAFGDSQVPGEPVVAHQFSRLDRALERRLASLPDYDGGDDAEEVHVALQRALTMSRSAYADAARQVIIFTDAPPKDEEAVCGLADKFRNSGVTAHVFGPSRPYVEAYRSLAETTGGQYFDICSELVKGIAGVIDKFSNARPT